MAPAPEIINSLIYADSKRPAPRGDLTVFPSCLFCFRKCFVCLFLLLFPQISVTAIPLIFLPDTCPKESKSICCAQVAKAERQHIGIFSHLLGRDWKSEIQIDLRCFMYLWGTCGIWPLYKYRAFLKVWSSLVQKFQYHHKDQSRNYSTCSPDRFGLLF